MHWTDSGLASWYDLAEAISEYAKGIGLVTNPAKIVPIKTSEYRLAAKRPIYSVLDVSKSLKYFETEQTYWRSSVKLLIEKIST